MSTFEVVQNPEVARLVRFSTGLLNPEAKNEIDFKCYSDKSNKRKLAVTTKINNIEYSGENFGQCNTFSAESCDYYVAVQRKGADKIQILPAELFSLHPKTEEEKGVSSDDEQDRKDDVKTFKEKFRSLTAQFGSGKSQKLMRKDMDRQMEDEAIGLMSQSVPVIPSKNPSSAVGGHSANVAESTVVPPHNKDAENPEDVYLLETIIPNWAMDPLREQSQVFVKCTTEEIAKWRKDKTYHSVVLDHLVDLPLSSEERQSKCSLIMYLYCLMFAYDLKAHVFRNTNNFPAEWKGLVKKLLLDRFSVCTQDLKGKQRRNRPPHLKDLILSHIIILNLRLNNYTYPLQPLIDDLKLSLKRTVLHATTLGLTVSGRLDKVVKLKTPFKLPTQSLKGKAKGKK